MEEKYLFIAQKIKQITALYDKLDHNFRQILELLTSGDDESRANAFTLTRQSEEMIANYFLSNNHNYL